MAHHPLTTRTKRTLLLQVMSMTHIIGGYNYNTLAMAPLHSVSVSRCTALLNGGPAQKGEPLRPMPAHTLSVLVISTAHTSSYLVRYEPGKTF